MLFSSSLLLMLLAVSLSFSQSVVDFVSGLSMLPGTPKRIYTSISIETFHKTLSTWAVQTNHIFWTPTYCVVNYSKNFKPRCSTTKVQKYLKNDNSVRKKSLRFLSMSNMHVRKQKFWFNGSGLSAS